MTVRQNIAAAVRDKARRQTEVAEKLAAVPAGGRGRPEAGAALRRAAAAVRPGPNPGVGAHGHPAGRALLRPGQLPEIPAGAGAGRTAGADSRARCSGSPMTGGRSSGTAAGCVSSDRGRSQPVTDPWGSCSAAPAHVGRCPALRLQATMPTPGPQGGCGVSCRTGDLTLSLRPLRCRRASDRDRHPGPPCSSWPVSGAENAFPCAVQYRWWRTCSAPSVLLRPLEGAAPEAPLLRMELDKDDRQAVPDKDRLTGLRSAGGHSAAGMR